MAERNEKRADVFGIAPYGEALNTLAKGAVDGASAFLSKICLPAAEEFGLLLRDRITAWRAKNAIDIALKAEVMFTNLSKGEELHAHPRLVMKVLGEGSWADDQKVQAMWAGLLASSCSKDGRDETNLIFVNILSQITSAQVAILNLACETSEKRVSGAGWLMAEPILTVELDELRRISGVTDSHRLDRELDHVRSLELIGGTYGGGFPVDSTVANITPTSLALQMYVRCQGYVGSVLRYFDLEEKSGDN